MVQSNQAIGYRSPLLAQDPCQARSELSRSRRRYGRVFGHGVLHAEPNFVQLHSDDAEEHVNSNLGRTRRPTLDKLRLRCSKKRDQIPRKSAFREHLSSVPSWRKSSHGCSAKLSKWDHTGESQHKSFVGRLIERPAMARLKKKWAHGRKVEQQVPPTLPPIRRHSVFRISMIM